jgi:hypothetical protein
MKRLYRGEVNILRRTWRVKGVFLGMGRKGNMVFLALEKGLFWAGLLLSLGGLWITHDLYFGISVDRRICERS